MRPLRRSVLYVPADNARALEKCRILPADAIIVDLEDAVSADAKDIAREAARHAPMEGREVALRLNPSDTPWHEADVEVARAAPFDAVVLPKVCEAREVMAVAERTGLCVWPMLETARGVLCAREIAEAAARSGP
ncbi:MAG: aldolase/citrate lyase family protein, partial [Pseudomonadota bacterium]